MKQRLILSLIIGLFSMGVFGQAYPKFTLPQKAIHHERPSVYHEMLSTYNSYRQLTLLKSATDLSVYLDTSQVMLFMGEDQYLPIFTQILSYDATGNMTSIQTNTLNADSYLWENTSNTKFSYDVKGNITQVIDEDWDASSSSWVPTNKAEYSYDTNDDLIQIIELEWVPSAGQFVNSRKVVRTFNAPGIQAQTLVSSWVVDPGLWVEVWKYEYSYDADDLLTVETEYEWDEDTSDWVFSWKTQNTYNEFKQLVISDESNWTTETSSWNPSWKRALTYDASGNVSQEIGSSYLESTTSWQEEGMGEYTYDELNQPLMEIYSTWDENVTQLVPTSKYEYLYDNGTLLSELVAPPANWFVPDYSEQIVSKPLSYISYEYNTENSTFEIYYLEVYFYNEHYPTKVIGSETSHIASIFPNPAQGYITFSFSGEFYQASFELYDVTGRRVIFKQVESGERLNLEDLQSGIYLYRISAEEQIQTGKLLKK